MYNILSFFQTRYKLFRTNLLNPNQAIELQNWEEDFDFWKPPKSGFSTDILVEPGQLETLSNQLKVGKFQKPILFFPIFKKMNKLTKGHLISKANYGLPTFSKKRTDEFDLFAFLLFTANKSNQIRSFFGRS